VSTAQVSTATDTREQLVARAKSKPVAPYALDEQLTFFCPRENLAGLELPVVHAFHRWVRDQHQPATGEPALLLLLPCQATKPYPLSAEHRAINGALLKAGYRPRGRGDWPEELAAHAPAELLANEPLAGHGVRIDRAVISEPFGLVPYEAVYRWREQPSPCARYDDPGLFEHRGIICGWRADCDARQVSGRRAHWGDRERADYVEVHNRLVASIAATLERWRGAYTQIVAYVAPGLTHRSFLASPAERRAAGLPSARRVDGRRLPLDSVAERLPGAVRLIPDGAQLAVLRAAGGGQLRPGLLSRPECLRLLTSEITAIERGR